MSVLAIDLDTLLRGSTYPRCAGSIPSSRGGPSLTAVSYRISPPCSSPRKSPTALNEDPALRPPACAWPCSAASSAPRYAGPLPDRQRPQWHR